MKEGYRNDFWTELKWRMVGAGAKLFIDTLFRTTRIEVVGFEEVRQLYEKREAIGVFWHSRILLISYLFKGWNASILTSRSRDGEYIARLVKRQGHEPIRGSTRKGGARAGAMLIRRLREGRPAVIIPDGPQGPRFKVQPGVITIAKKSGSPIVPMTYSAARIKVFKSWDRFILPMPFTGCLMVYGKPIQVPKDADQALEEDCRLRLEQELKRITEDADRRFGHVIE
ncbi:MAG: DUF374 domain-containing protein [Desulfobacteraceae bacterium]|nr:MAG: DUF374 domain-containing protein [Desulfobacteraceae bacterium]